MVLTRARYTAQTPASIAGQRAHIVGDQHQHRRYRATKGGYASKSPRT
jgi:hypothetical protein